MITQEINDVNYLAIKKIIDEFTDNGKNDKWFLTPIEDLEFTIRTENCLKFAGICTLEELKQKTDYELRIIPQFGKKCLAEVRAILKHLENKNVD